MLNAIGEIILLSFENLPLYRILKFMRMDNRSMEGILIISRHPHCPPTFKLLMSKYVLFKKNTHTQTKTEHLKVIIWMKANNYSLRGER